MYLKATGREAIADAADKVADDLRPDDGALVRPADRDRPRRAQAADQRPALPRPRPPRRRRGVGAAAEENDWPLEISVGADRQSCTNSSYEDITRAASIARQAAATGLKAKTELLDHARLGADPGDDRARRAARRPRGDRRHRAGQRLRAVHRPVGAARRRSPGTPNTIVNSFNRNFPKRNDGSANTLSFVTSPDTVIALALAGRLDFDPTTDTITAPDGTEVHARGAGRRGAARRRATTRARTRSPRRRPTAPASTVEVVARPATACSCWSRSRPWDGKDYLGLPVLMKAQGKCTTDHISAAGKWLKYRGHLENISGNLFLGVVNAFTGAAGEGKDFTDGATRHVPRHRQAATARPASRGCAIGDRNYGEGSSREHAAMEPRFRGGVVIFARSFARIHETNAKKQGLVPLTFADPATYDADRRGRPHQRARPAAGAGPERALPDRQARRHDDRLRGTCTRSAPSRSSGSRPARRSTSCARRSPPSPDPSLRCRCTGARAGHRHRWKRSPISRRGRNRSRAAT